ncbi:MAG TPA: hypothetical protein VLK84_25595 [Longimicrobium sp.]|nr:hypothetical protein [Longimicrobium sp.]
MDEEDDLHRPPPSNEHASADIEPGRAEIQEEVAGIQPKVAETQMGVSGIQPGE